MLHRCTCQGVLLLVRSSPCSLSATPPPHAAYVPRRTYSTWLVVDQLNAGCYALAVVQSRQSLTVMPCAGLRADTIVVVRRSMELTGSGALCVHERVAEMGRVGVQCTAIFSMLCSVVSLSGRLVLADRQTAVVLGLSSGGRVAPPRWTRRLVDSRTCMSITTAVLQHHHPRRPASK